MVLLALPKIGAEDFALEMTRMDFDMNAFCNALEERRIARGLSWAAVAREINRGETQGRALAASTIIGLKGKAQVEGDGVLQMLLWLERTPESFVLGVKDADAARFRLRNIETQVLRWDTQALYLALNTRRLIKGMTWTEVAQEVGGMTPGMLTRLAKRGRVGFPGVMRLVRWLGQPAAVFTRVSDQ